VAPATVWNILHQAGLDPAPRRVFLRRVYVFCVLELGTRRVHILGATQHPTREWVTQQARNFLADLGERAECFGFLVRDRDTKFTASLDAVFAGAGIAVLRSPPRAPKANACAEGWVGTVRRECLDRILIFHECQLVHVLAEYETHDNTHRPHRALEQRPPIECGQTQRPCSTGTIRRTRVLGGLITEYRHAA
jgi:hypothetical protein